MIWRWKWPHRISRTSLPRTASARSAGLPSPSARWSALSRVTGGWCRTTVVPCGRRGAQQLAQPVELGGAEMSVHLARHERVERDDPVSVDHAGRRQLAVGAKRVVLGAVSAGRVQVSAAQRLREGAALVVVAGGAEHRDVPLPGERAHEVPYDRVLLGRPAVREVPADDDGPEARETPDVGEHPAQRLGRVDAVAVGCAGVVDVGVGEMQDPHPGDATPGPRRPHRIRADPVRSGLKAPVPAPVWSAARPGAGTGPRADYRPRTDKRPDKWPGSLR